MLWRSLLCIVAAGWGPVAPGLSAGSAIERAEELLRSGQPEAALKRCREARVEHPDSIELVFAIATAEAAAGEALLGDGSREEAAELLRRAWVSFNRVAVGEARELHAGAEYNAATCLLLLDAALDVPDGYEARVENLEAAVAAFESFTSRHPEHGQGRKNLDYARYHLSVLKQNPPEDEAPEDSEDDEEPAPASAVSVAITELPDATVEVLDGNTVVLHGRPEMEEDP